MTSDRVPPKEPPTADRRAEREAKLAQALRANLRRRKASPPAPRGQGGDGGDSG